MVLGESLMKALVRRALRRVGVDILNRRAMAPLNTSLSAYRPYTLVTDDRLHVLVSAARMTAHLPGDVAECGVYRGGTAMLLRDHRAPDKHLYLMDTFGGMPDLITDRDLHTAGDFADTSLAAVHAVVGEHQITYLQGLFAERFAEIDDRTFSFVHVDADLYQSVAECIEFFVPRMSGGGGDRVR